MTDKDGYTAQLVENTNLICKNGKMVIPKSLQQHTVAWYHHYLQHPGNTRLEETLRLLMYWKGLRKTVQSNVKKCHSCQVKNAETINMQSCRKNFPSPPLGKRYVWNSYDHIPSKVKTRQKLTLCTSQ